MGDAVAPADLAMENILVEEEIQDMQGWIMIGGLLFSIFWTARLIYDHVEPHVWHDKVDRWVLGLIFVAFVIAWIPCWLLPIDFVGMEVRILERLRCAELEYSWLQFFWLIIYVTNLAAGYLTYDFARSYLDAGGFTIRRRLSLAWVDIRVWCVCRTRQQLYVHHPPGCRPLTVRIPPTTATAGTAGRFSWS